MVHQLQRPRLISQCPCMCWRQVSAVVVVYCAPFANRVWVHLFSAPTMSKERRDASPTQVWCRRSVPHVVMQTKQGLAPGAQHLHPWATAPSPGSSPASPASCVPQHFPCVQRQVREAGCLVHLRDTAQPRTRACVVVQCHVDERRQPASRTCFDCLKRIRCKCTATAAGIHGSRAGHQHGAALAWQGTVVICSEWRRVGG